MTEGGTSSAAGTGAPRARIKERPEDFVVEEIPAYDPSGAGAHVFVRFTKTDRTTLDAVRDIARALGCDPRAAGFAGMKDRRAVTTQTISLEAPRGVDPLELAGRARAIAIAGICVHDAKPHAHKMKPGHLGGNRFAIALRGVPAERVAEVTRALDRVAAEGVPNAFGAQRYGRQGDNASRALAWLRDGGPAPARDPRVQRLLWSSLQSAVFDAVLAERIRDGTWATPIEGDLLKLRSSGGLFVCADVQTDRARALQGEVSPTGPIAGARMRWPEGAAAALERRVCAEILGESFDFARVRRLGEGSRRALRIWVEGVRYEVEDDPSGHAAPCLRVYFVLPKGAYATTVLRAAVDLEESHGVGNDEERFREEPRQAEAAEPAEPEEEPEDA
jgi:tRNA pseudouridine13 synthase